jgi:gamma-glutamylaminecyclotransferase
MLTLVFVYGTLKQGFRNAHVNTGRRVPGAFVSVERLPLYVIGPAQLPWLVDRPGQGEHVIGELYEVDEVALARMDALERITEPDWYSRGRIAVRALGDAQAAVLTAQVYYGSAERAQREAAHFGPLAEYAQQHAAAYRPSPP